MKKQFVTYEIALKLKELGFDESCFAVFDRNGELTGIDFIDISNLRGINYSEVTYNYPILVPLWQQVIDWFREKHNKIITIYSCASGYVWETHDAIGGTEREWSEYSGPNEGGCWDDYDDCRENAILKAIELCKKEK